MALVAFLGGVNVGGHKRFRLSILAKELPDYDVVNVGAAGSFVIHRPGSRAQFQAELVRRLPFEAEMIMCRGGDLLRLEAQDPFASEPARPGIVRFVSILSSARPRIPLPMALPADGESLVRIIGAKGRFVFGVYRRHLQTIRYLGQMDRLFGTPVTTRNWNTILAIVNILKRGSAG